MNDKHRASTGRKAMGIRKRSPLSTQLTIRVSDDVLARLDALIPWQSNKVGKVTSRVEVLREAVMRGLSRLEKDAGEE
jgi:predicted transcriptional regulator